MERSPSRRRTPPRSTAHSQGRRLGGEHEHVERGQERPSRRSSRTRTRSRRLPARRRSRTDDRVRLGATYAPGGDPQERCTSSPAPTATSVRPRRDGLRHGPVAEDHRRRRPRRLLPEHRQPDRSRTRARSAILVVMNDLRAKSEAYIDNAHRRRRRNVTVNADETAQLLSEATSTVTASGGSFYGAGTVQAINGQVVTNVVLASATAAITDSDVDGRRRRRSSPRRTTPASTRRSSSRRSTRRPRVRDHARVQLARLEPAEHPLQPGRHDPRRPADRGRAQRRGPVARRRRRSRTRRSTPTAT